MSALMTPWLAENSWLITRVQEELYKKHNEKVLAQADGSNAENGYETEVGSDESAGEECEEDLNLQSAM